MAKKERRFDQYGPLLKMAEAEGYAMVRRPYCMPFVIDIKKWNSLPPTPPAIEEM